MQPPDLTRQGFATRYLTLFGGEAFSKLCVVAAFAYLARALGPSDFGIIELALSLTVFFVLGVESGMGSYGARLVAASPDRIPTLVPSIMLLRACYGVPAYLIVLAVASHYRVSGLGILALNGLTVLLTPFYLQWVFQGLRQMQWVAAGTAVRNLLFVVLVFSLIRPGSDIRLVAVAEVAGATALATFNLVVLFRRLRARLHWREAPAGMRRIFGDVWYLGLGDLMWACLWYSPAIIMGWIAIAQPEEVAWIAAPVRIVIALHTFVWLYFFNLLPDLARAIMSGVDDWRDLATRSIGSSIWPACLIAVGGTTFAPILIPLIYGEAYAAAVPTFQIVIWMIPVTWYSGHARYSLLAAGLQRWEFLAAVATAIVTVLAALLLGRVFGSTGAAAGLLIGGLVNAVLAEIAMRTTIGPLPLRRNLQPVLIAAAAALAAGLATTRAAGPWAGSVIATLLFVALALRQRNALVALVRRLR